MQNQKKKQKPARKTGMGRIVRAFFFSIQGLKDGWGEEAFRQECLLAFVLIPLGFLLNVPIYMRLILFLSMLGVGIIELLNTAIESVADFTSPEYEDLIRRAKDLGSAAVFLGFVGLAASWIVALSIALFQEKIFCIF